MTTRAGLGALDGGEAEGEGGEAFASRNGDGGAVTEGGDEAVDLLIVRVVLGDEAAIGGSAGLRDGADEGVLSRVVLDEPAAPGELEGGAEAGGVHPGRLDVGDRAGVEGERGESVIGSVAVLEADAPGVQVRDLAEGPAEPVEVVDREVEQDAAALGEVLEPTLGADRSLAAATRAGGGGGADRAALDQRAGARVLGEVADDLGGHQGHARPLGGLDERQALLEGAGQRLLHQHGASGGDGPSAELQVERRGKADVDGVAPLEQRLERVERRAAAGFREGDAPFTVAVVDEKLHVAAPRVLPRVDATHTAPAPRRPIRIPRECDRWWVV